MGENVGKLCGHEGSPSNPPPRGAGGVGRLFRTRLFNLAEPWRLYLTYWGVSWRGYKICALGLNTHPTKLGGDGGKKREGASARPTA